jgi:4-hydroxy-tetrahydrodipicolinate synthase
LTALPTPFLNDEIAEEPFARLIAWQIEQGCRGLVVCSATGEGSTLAPQERRRLIEIAVYAAAGRAPIIAATGTNCTAETTALTEAAQAAGATAALIVTPYYNKPGQRGLYEHYRAIARSVDLPLIIEADPSRTAVDIDPETLAQLAEIPNIVAIEDAESGFPASARRAVASRPKFLRFCGDDRESVSFRMAGGQGCVSVVANVVPAFWAAMQRANDAQDWGRAMLIQMALQPLVSALRLETNPAPIKFALSVLHPWFSPQMRPPLGPVSVATAAAIRAALAHL